jgi:hypothetical protein
MTLAAPLGEAQTAEPEAESGASVPGLALRAGALAPFPQRLTSPWGKGV